MKSLAQARIKRSHALRLAAEGKSFDEIASEVGFSHRGSAHRAVYKALADHEAADVQQLRAMEMDRLDYMLSRLWPRIEQGDVDAISTALRITDARCRFTGLYGPGQKRQKPDQGFVSLVQPGAKATHGGQQACS